MVIENKEKPCCRTTGPEKINLFIAMILLLLF
jgi:hypothetical protein